VEILLGILAGMVLAWMVLAATLFLARPRGTSLGEFARLLPDTLRLFRSLIRDPAVRVGIKLRLWGLLIYLASPLDLVPDLIPVIGSADDAIIAAIVLRSVIRRTGRDKVREHWSGTGEGLDALLRACQAG
jgi:uncharacterized membrane protein YkvA (DUF1232 family)